MTSPRDRESHPPLDLPRSRQPPGSRSLPGTWLVTLVPGQYGLTPNSSTSGVLWSLALQRTLMSQDAPRCPCSESLQSAGPRYQLIVLRPNWATRPHCPLHSYHKLHPSPSQFPTRSVRYFFNSFNLPLESDHLVLYFSPHLIDEFQGCRPSKPTIGRRK